MTTQQPVFTDWISCATPPLREGVYEVRHLANPAHNWKAFYHYISQDWQHATSYYFMYVVKERPAIYEWRGIRRWVLQSAASLGSGVLYLTDEPWHEHWNCDLALARGFDTEQEALSVGILLLTTDYVAVLP